MNTLNQVLTLTGVEGGVVRHHQVSEIVHLSGAYANVWCNVRGEVHTRLIAAGSPEIKEGPQVKEGSGHFWRQQWTATVSGPWAVIVGLAADGCNSPDRYIAEVHVWGNPDVEAIIKVVAEHLRGRGANLGLLLAGNDPLAQKYWVKENIHPGSKPWLVEVGGVECPIRHRHGLELEIGDPKIGNVSDSGAASKIFNWADPEEQIGFLPPAQREYASALLNPEKAAEWANTHLRFFKIGGKIFTPTEKGELQEFQVRDWYGPDGPFAVLNHRRELVEQLIAVGPELREPIEVGHVNLFNYTWYHEAHLGAAGFPEAWNFGGTAQAANIRFVFAAERFQGPLTLAIAEANGPEDMEPRPSAEKAEGYVWRDRERFNWDYGFCRPGRDGKSRLQIWKVK